MERFAADVTPALEVRIDQLTRLYDLPADSSEDTILAAIRSTPPVTLFPEVAKAQRHGRKPEPSPSFRAALSQPLTLHY